MVPALLPTAMHPFLEVLKGSIVQPYTYNVTKKQFCSHSCATDWIEHAYVHTCHCPGLTACYGSFFAYVTGSHVEA